MRARQRHPKFKSYGSTLAFEANKISEADGAEVATWTDSTGSGNTAINNTAGFRPNFRKSGINNQPALEFDGAADVLQIQSSFTSGCVFLVLDLDTDVNHGIMGDFGSLASSSVIGLHSGSYKLFKIGSETWNASGDYVFADRVFWNEVDSSNGNASPAVAVYDRNSRSAVSYASGVDIGRQATSFTFTDGMIGVIVSLPFSPSSSLRKRISNSLAMLYKIRN